MLLFGGRRTSKLENYIGARALRKSSNFIDVFATGSKLSTKTYYKTVFIKKQRGEALISYDGFVANVYQCHKSLSSRLILSTFIGFIAYC